VDPRLFWENEYRGIGENYLTLLGLYAKAYLIYVGLLGAALKFALDDKSTPPLRGAMCIFALSTCVVFCMCIASAVITTKKMKKRRDFALQQLNIAESDNYDGAYYLSHIGSVVFIIFTAVAIVGWVMILTGRF